MRPNHRPKSRSHLKVALIAGIRGTIRDKKRRVDVLKAEIEIDELIKKEKALLIKRKTIEEEMRVKERQMNVADIELSMGRRRLEELKRVVHEEQPYAEPSPLPPSPDFYESGPQSSVHSPPSRPAAPPGGAGGNPTEDGELRTGDR